MRRSRGRKTYMMPLSRFRSLLAHIAFSACELRDVCTHSLKACVYKSVTRIAMEMGPGQTELEILRLHRRPFMKTFLVLFLLAAPAFAQNPTDTAVAPGCGPGNAKFEVKTESKQHPLAQPEAGKALVYFLE